MEIRTAFNLKFHAFSIIFLNMVVIKNLISLSKVLSILLVVWNTEARIFFKLNWIAQFNFLKQILKFDWIKVIKFNGLTDEKGFAVP